MLGNEQAVSKLLHNCALSHKLGLKPFRRCADCELRNARQCPPIRASILLVVAVVCEGATAWYFGGAVLNTIFVITALAAVLILSLINARTDERVRSRRRLLELRREQAEQHEFLKKLSPLESLDECLEKIIDSAIERLRCGRVSVMLADEACEYLYIAASRGVPQDVVDSTRIPIGERIAGRVFQSDTPLHIRGAQNTDEALPIDSDAIMSAPLLLSNMSWGKIRLGVLSITEPVGRDDFTIEDEFVFSNICEASAVAIHNQQAVARVKRSNVEFLETLVNAIEARDKYTRGHSDRVARYAVAIGEQMSLSDKSLDELSMAGRLHDIGKIGVADEILYKRSAPSEDEWDRIRQHPVTATEMLADASLLSGAMDAIRCHHERLDGSGYPQGLSDGDIPLPARIVCVADAFDAMTTRRTYSKAMSLRDALAEMLKNAGKQFDLACVEALAEAVGSGKLTDVLPTETESAPVARGLSASAGRGFA